MKAIYLILVAMLIGACAPTAAQTPPPAKPTPETEFVIEPIQIDQVDVRIMESFPVQVAAHITGVVGDGCSSLHGVTQAREDNTITLTIERRRELAEACTMIAQLYDETIRLEGEFPTGDYTLIVNGVEKHFHVD